MSNMRRSSKKGCSSLSLQTTTIITTNATTKTLNACGENLGQGKFQATHFLVDNPTLSGRSCSFLAVFACDTSVCVWAIPARIVFPSFPKTSTACRRRCGNHGRPDWFYILLSIESLWLCCSYHKSSWLNINQTSKYSWEIIFRQAKAPVAKTRKLVVDPPKKMTYR